MNVNYVNYVHFVMLKEGTQSIKDFLDQYYCCVLFEDKPMLDILETFTNNLSQEFDWKYSKGKKFWFSGFRELVDTPMYYTFYFSVKLNWRGFFGNLKRLYAPLMPFRSLMNENDGYIKGWQLLGQSTRAVKPERRRKITRIHPSKSIF